MNNAAMKHAIRLVSSSLAIMAIFSGAVTAQAAEASSANAASFKAVTHAAITAGLTGAKGSAETPGIAPAIAVKKEATTHKEAVAVKKYPFSLDMDIATDPGYGHIHPGGTGDNDQNIKTMWTNLPITVEDENGNKIEAKKELQSGWERFVGDFAVGQKLTITIDTRGIPEGYHISYDRDREYIPAKGYFKFTVIYKLDNGKPIPLRISFGKLNVKFDLQGGNIGGKTDAITNTVKTDNTVDFPANPTKENLVFGGWYTEFPDIEYYRDHNMVGTRRYWTNKSLFSDTSCDLPQWNDEKLDPRGDYQFLLRAQWNAKVSFDANGGTFSNGKREISALRRQGLKVKLLNAPTREDYQFLNWVDAAGKAYKPDDMYALNANTAFTAQWKQIRSIVTFKDGDKTQTVKVETGKAIDSDALTDQSMPKNPTKDGYTFKEWNTKADGKGTAFTGKTTVNSDTTVYAIFTKNPVSEPTQHPTSNPIPSASFESESGSESPVTVPESQTPESVNKIEHESVKSPVVEHKAEKHVPDMPKSGESASVVAFISALVFAIAGFVVVRMRRMFEAKSGR